MESRKRVLKKLFTGQQWRNRHREQTYGPGERGGEGEMYGESNRETYITMCKISSQQGEGGGNLSITLQWMLHICSSASASSVNFRSCSMYLLKIFHM